jgi:hypothetical protein
MNPDDAAKQLQYTINSSTDTRDYTITYWESKVYQDAFAEVTERGSLSDVMDLISQLGVECDAKSRPSPDEACQLADRILSGQSQPLTDGGSSI